MRLLAQPCLTISWKYACRWQHSLTGAGHLSGTQCLSLAPPLKGRKQSEVAGALMPGHTGAQGLSRDQSEGGSGIPAQSVWLCQ